MKRILILVSVAAVLASCSGKRNGYNASGTFDAAEVIVSSEVAGLIVEFSAEEGTVLAKGELAGMIDTVQLHLQKQQLLHNISALEKSCPAVETQLAPLEEQLAKQKQEKNRIENLLKADAATQKQLDDISSAIAVLQKQLEAHDNTMHHSIASIEAQIAGLRVQVAQVDDRLERCRITSPIPGVVVAKYAQAGELANTGRPLMKVADLGNIHLKAYLTSSQLAGVKLGQEVTVSADFGNGNRREYPGKVTWISDKSEFTPKNIVTSDDRADMVYAVKIAVENDGYIKLGMFGEVKL